MNPRTRSRPALVLLVAIVLATAFGACASTEKSQFNGPAGADASSDGSADHSVGVMSDDGPQLVGDDTGGADVTGVLLISPNAKTIDVNVGQNTPTVTYTATL